ncbi:MAG: agmatinase [Candidatus Obscuribacterales bacterium]|jgi:agmatinase|nr:agmatinase [Candidatus Obscuribacterales bacterium]
MSESSNNFFGLSAEDSSIEKSRVAIVPVPYEATTSYGKGTAKGPQAILEASQQVELFDDELWVEPCKVGIQTVAPVIMEPQHNETSEPFKALQNAVSPLVEFNKFPIIVGGEHALTLGAVKACTQRYPDLSILQIDAHADLRQSYDNNIHSHACVSYQLYQNLPKPNITQVGIRNISKEEVDWMEQAKPNIHIFWARNQDKWNPLDIISTLSDNVYLTIDVDGLDSGIMPATGTPEPGGLGWYQLMDLIKQLCIRKNVVAADIVEFAPIDGLHAPAFLAAKLMYKIIGYKFALDLGVTKKY